MRGIKQYYNYTIISLRELISKTNTHVINYYYDNGLVIEKINRDFKKIFVHFLIKDLCIDCLSIKGVTQKVLFCDPQILPKDSEIFEYVEYSKYVTFLKNVLKELASMIPVTVFESMDMDFVEISENSKSNDLRYALDIIHAKSQTKSIHKLTQYAEQLGLNFLHKDYLNGLSLRKIFV